VAVIVAVAIVGIPVLGVFQNWWGGITHAHSIGAVVTWFWLPLIEVAQVAALVIALKVLVERAAA
jgi:hypothetical protein